MMMMMSVVHWRFPSKMRNLSNNQLILLTCIKTWFRTQERIWHAIMLEAIIKVTIKVGRDKEHLLVMLTKIYSSWCFKTYIKSILLFVLTRIESSRIGKLRKQKIKIKLRHLQPIESVVFTMMPIKSSMNKYQMVTSWRRAVEVIHLDLNVRSHRVSALCFVCVCISCILKPLWLPCLLYLNGVSVGLAFHEFVIL